MEVTRSKVIERADIGAAFQAKSPRDPTAQAEVGVLLAQLRVVLAHVRAARSRLERAASDLRRDGGGDRGVPDPRRLPRFAATVAQDLTMARPNADRGVVEEPTAAELAVLGCLATLPRRDRRAALRMSLNGVWTREL